MEIMVDKPWFIEEVGKVAKNVARRYCEKRSVVEALTGVLIAKNNESSKKGPNRTL